jgi:hydroxymethylpyrimidine/phosphomethylpyrimidine kinase
MKRTDPQPVALTIAGSDSGGGAGVQADLKTFEAHGVFGASAITAITAQNTVEVRRIDVLSPEAVTAQIEAVLEDLPVRAAKTGMLARAEIVRAVVRAWGARPGVPLVVDPVMVSKGGAVLLDDAATAAVRDLLLPLAAVVTPNLPEAAHLLGSAPIGDRRAMGEAARAIHAMGPRVVIVKGGHLAGRPVDVVFDGASEWEVSAERVDTRHTHGTGCTFSAAIAARLALGDDVETAIRGARAYLQGAIVHAPGLGAGHGPVAHFHPEAPIRRR